LKLETNEILDSPLRFIE